MWSGYLMSDEFVLDDDLFSFEAKVQPTDESVSEQDDSDESDDKPTDLGEFNFEKPPEP